MVAENSQFIESKKMIKKINIWTIPLFIGIHLIYSTLCYSQGFGNSPDGSESSILLRNTSSTTEKDATLLKQDLESSKAQQTTQGRPPIPESPTPSLFQTFLFRTTGNVLPIYGQALFDRPNLYNERQNAPVPSDYVVGPGDEIFIKIYGGTIDFDQRALVDRQGMIALPKIGPVSVAGIKVSELEGYLKEKVGRVLTNFKVFVSLGQLRSIEVYVVGQARRPGKHVVSSLSTIISTLFATGGPNSNGSMRKIQLIRNSKIISTLDLYDFFTKGNTSQDKHLLAGDVISIPPVGSSVALMGAIPEAGIFELSSDSATSISSLLPLAGGLPAQTSTLKFTLERIEPSKTKPMSVLTLSLNENDLKTPLKDGDVLNFYPVKPAFENAVTLRIAHANPIRLPVGENTHIRDVLPSKDELLTNDYYIRQLFGSDFEATPMASFETRNPYKIDLTPEEKTMNRDERFNDNKTFINKQQREFNQSKYQKYENEKNQTSPQSEFAQALALSKALGADTWKLKNKYFEKFDDAKRIRLRNELDQINWDQAIIERQSKTDFNLQIIPFNLGQAILEKDSPDNVLLQPGDTITVFTQHDVQTPVEKRTRIVRLQGEVKLPGIYQIQPGEAIPSVIKRAGGITENGYIYGIEVSRESVKTRQKENLRIVIRQLEAQIKEQNIRVMASATQGESFNQASAIAEQNTRSLQAQIARLEELTPNGRVTLETRPDQKDLPELMLEDGDEILVPTKPGFVSTVGAVYNDNVLIYHEGKRVNDYLEVAGVSESAEKDNTFILRANGSIVSRSSANVLRSELYPGDTIVVPEKVFQESGYSVFMRGLKDWTQIFSNFGLGAAALNQLRNNPK